MTEIICILDRSGSMHAMADEVINSFNEFVNTQKKLPITTKDDKLTLVLFDDKYEIVHYQIPLLETPALTKTKYFVRGMTSLNDAIGKSIYGVHPTKTNVIVLIQTDGQENASKEFKSEQIKKLIKEKERIGWEFNFVGAGLDAFNQGESYGFTNNVFVEPSNAGIQKSLGFLGAQCSNYRNVQAANQSRLGTGFRF